MDRRFSIHIGWVKVHQGSQVLGPHTDYDTRLYYMYEVTLRVQSLFFRTFGDKKYFFKAVSHINSVLTAFSRPSSLQSLYGPGTRQGRYIYY